MNKNFSFKFSEEEYKNHGILVDGSEVHEAILSGWSYYIKFYGYDAIRVYPVGTVEKAIKEGAWIVVE